MNPSIVSTDIYQYTLFFFLTILQGPTAMLAAGFLLRLGNMALVPLFFTLLLADLTADFVWYGIGHTWAHPFLKKYGKFFHLTEPRINNLARLLHAHSKKILFISKTTLGFGLSNATLLAAGIAKIPIKTYAIINILGGFIWISGLIAIGYFFGDFYTKVAHGFEIAFLISLGLIVIAILTLVGRAMQKKYIEGEK